MSEDSNDKPLSITESLRRRIALEKLNKPDPPMPELSPEDQRSIDRLVQIVKDAAQKSVKDIEHRRLDKKRATDGQDQTNSFEP